VWSWDITYLRSPIKGVFWLLYMVVDVWSRKVDAAQVYDRESDGLAAELIRQACQREGIDRRRSGLVVHSDNGPAMKGKTLLAAMQTLGIVPSFSRPTSATTTRSRAARGSAARDAGGRHRARPPGPEVTRRAARRGRPRWRSWRSAGPAAK
jgi:hypothetical protein